MPPPLASHPHLPPVSVLILAGGRSTRMGQDKAWLAFDGQPLVERVARRVLPLAGEIIFSTNTPDRFRDLAVALPVPTQIVPDAQTGAGPLAGLAAGLQAARHDLVVTLAVDMPLVSPELLGYMVSIAASYDAVVPLVAVPGAAEPQGEPLHAIYRKSCLPAITACLAEGRRRLVSFLPLVQVYYLAPPEISRFDPAFRSFLNVNTPEDWARAQTA